jgi:heme/copper-type cytochrome/quinol oxidase subunit 2
MEGPISFWGYKEQEWNLILPEHDNDDDDIKIFVLVFIGIVIIFNLIYLLLNYFVLIYFEELGKFFLSISLQKHLSCEFL